MRGAFHPGPEDGVKGGTLVLAGTVGDSAWGTFSSSPEAADGRLDPLDRWSRRVVGLAAERLGAKALYPFGGPPHWPFQRWGARAEALGSSPLGLLIHPDFGLWHGYRGALLFAERIEAAPPVRRPRPCDTCADKPCLSACPVDAFAAGGFDEARCLGHIGSAAGAECMTGSCRARRACPVGAAYRYGPEQSAFHMNAYLAAARRRRC